MEKKRIILMSIMTYYADQIFNGNKIYEFRKSPIKDSDLNQRIYIYSAKDKKAIVGYFKVSAILKGNTTSIIKDTGYEKKADNHEIIKYFGPNNSNCYALKLYEVTSFAKPITLSDLRKIDPGISLPQYYKYIYEYDRFYKFINEWEQEK